MTGRGHGQLIINRSQSEDIELLMGRVLSEYKALISSLALGEETCICGLWG